MTTKTYPVNFRDICVERGLAGARHMWGMRGPSGTMIEWIDCYLPVGPMGQLGNPVIVETLKDDNGWQVFTAHPTSNRIDETFADLLTRCFP